MVSQRQTDSHVYFWGGVYSNFFQRPAAKVLFKQALWRNGPAVDFNSSEQYLMASKAILFGDVLGFRDERNTAWNPSTLEMILSSKTPKDQKSLGRKVVGFEKGEWELHARQVMFRALWAKFTQNEDLTELLIESGDRIMVEGSPYDTIWGVGLAWDDPKIENERNWKGTNWLGKSLMQVRSALKAYAEGETVVLF